MDVSKNEGLIEPLVCWRPASLVSRFPFAYVHWYSIAPPGFEPGLLIQNQTGTSINDDNLSNSEESLVSVPDFSVINAVFCRTKWIMYGSLPQIHRCLLRSRRYCLHGRARHTVDSFRARDSKVDMKASGSPH